MRWTRRKLLVFAVLLVALFCLELGREEIVHLYVSSNLEHGYWQVRPNMTRGQVRELLGQPDVVKIEEGTVENWHWDARLHQGWLWRATGLASLKKHYQLVVSFSGEQQTVTDVFGESR